MKRKILYACVGVLILGAAIVGYSGAGQSNNFELLTGELEALTLNENGCVNKPGSNDGHCATDGTFYLCENSGSKDCKKGVYPN